MALDLKAFQKTQVYQARAPASEVLEDLRRLAARPERPRGPARGGVWVGMGLIVAAVLGLVAFALVGPPLAAQEEFPTWLTLLCAGMILGGLVTLIVSQADVPGGFKWTRFPVEPQMEQRRLLLATLLRRFQVDLLEDAPVEVTLDLTPTLEMRKRVHLGDRGEWTCQDFVDPWLSLQGRFADGTRLRLTLVEQVRKLHRARRNARGRMKHKVRHDALSLLEVALRVEPERYPGLAVLEERARGAVRLPTGATLKRLRVAEDRLELRVQLDEDWVAQVSRAPEPSGAPQGRPWPRDLSKTDASRTATMMLLSLYQVLNHSSSRGQPGKMRSMP